MAWVSAYQGNYLELTNNYYLCGTYIGHLRVWMHQYFERRDTFHLEW